MTRGDYIRSLSDKELAMYLYLNKTKTRLGYKKLAIWVEEEIKPLEEESK